MTYFETPADKAAWLADMTTEAYEAREDAIVADLEWLDANGQPHLEPEDRDYVDESLMTLVTAADRADLQLVLDWEAFEGMGR